MSKTKKMLKKIMIVLATVLMVVSSTIVIKPYEVNALSTKVSGDEFMAKAKEVAAGWESRYGQGGSYRAVGTCTGFFYRMLGYYGLLPSVDWYMNDNVSIGPGAVSGTYKPSDPYSAAYSEARMDPDRTENFLRNLVNGGSDEVILVWEGRIGTITQSIANTLRDGDLAVQTKADKGTTFGHLGFILKEDNKLWMFGANNDTNGIGRARLNNSLTLNGSSMSTFSTDIHVDPYEYIRIYRVLSDYEEPSIKQVNSNQTSQITSSEAVNVSLTKSDGDDGRKISDVTFDFYRDGVRFASGIKTNASGIASATYNGSYTGNGTGSSTKQYIENYDKLNAEDKETYKNYYKSKAEAQAAADAEALAIAQANARANAIAQVTTGHTYMAVETATKTGYYLNPSADRVSQALTLTSANDPEGDLTYNASINLSMSNTRVTAIAKIKKVDSENMTSTPQGDATLHGGTYTLYAAENITSPANGEVVLNKDAIVGVATIGANGEGQVAVPYLGKYYWLETSNPEGYALDPNKHEISITASGTSTEVMTDNIQVTERVYKGRLNLEKIDAETGKPINIAGAVFDVYLESSGAKVATITTDENGIALSDPLPYGKYYVKETQAPEGYAVTADNSGVIFVDQDGEIYDFEFTNERVTGTVSISKVDSVTGKTPQGEATLEGAVYGLYAKEDIMDPSNDGTVIHQAGKQIATLTTDEDGNASVDNLYLGSYYIKEITPPNGYNLDDTQYDIELTYQDQNTSVVVSNSELKDEIISAPFGILKIKSSNESGEGVVLEGAEFTVKSKKELDAKKAELGIISEGYDEVWDLVGIAKNANNEETKILVTNEAGMAVSDKLPFGSYIVRETKTPDEHYAVDDFEVVIDEDRDDPKIYRAFLDKEFESILKIVKKDAETGKTVLRAGATYHIYNADTDEMWGYYDYTQNGAKITEFTTNENGYVMTGDPLPVGNYELEEISAPEGYVLNEDRIPFKITMAGAYEILEDGMPVITVNADDTSAKGQINVYKEGEVLKGFENGNFVYENAYLEGMEVEIYARENILDPSNDGTILYNKDTLVDTITTGADGRALSKELPLGKYYVKEKTAPEGYLINETEYDVELTYQDQNTSVVLTNTTINNNRQKYDIELNKIDKDDKTTPLSGAEFNLIANEDILSHDGTIIFDEGDTISSYVSNDEGKVNIQEDLPYNTSFALIETKAPIGYVLNTDPIEFETTYTTQDEALVSLSYTKENKITETYISKLDITDSSEIEGAHLTIYEKGNEGAVFDTWVSAKEPHLIKGLEMDKTYVLKETSAPYGFAVAEEIEFTLDESGVTRIEMKDELSKGKLSFIKTGEVFSHTDTYQTEFGMVNTPVWTKQNILNANITIYAAEDIKVGNNVYYAKDEEIQTLESDLDPVESIELPVGEYYYVETTTPHGYIEDVSKHYFTIEDHQTIDTQTVESELYNDRAKVNIDFTKVLEDQKYFDNPEAYKDVVFGIYAKEDIYNYMGEVEIPYDTLIATVTINEDGQLENVPDLPNGMYYLKELKTNDQYKLNDTEYVFEIGYKGKNVTEYTVVVNNGEDISNDLKKGEIVITKKDLLDTEKILEGVEFNLYTDKELKEIKATASTDNKGKAYFKDLEMGTYYIKEAEQVDGYSLNEKVYEVTLKDDGDILEIEAVNAPTNFFILKVDVNGNTLSGATLQLIDKDTGEVLDEWVSEEKAHLITYLVEGKKYIIKEKKAPENYVKAPDMEFTFKDGMTLKYVNEKEPYTGSKDLTPLIGIELLALGGLILTVSLKKKNKES